MATKDAEVDQEQGFLSHLVELRDRLLRMMLSVAVLFLGLFWFSDQIYTWLASPLLKHLPDSQMIAIDVAAPFFIPFKLTLMVCVFLAVPYLLYQVWAFVAPGLYTHEKRLVMPLLVSSTLLFYAGVAFAYYVVFPLVFGFFTAVAPEGVEVSTDIARYLDFVITLFFAFGIAFEVPVATVLVVAVGVTTPEQLVKIRPYVFVAAFIVGMFLTPPDIISQTLLALPMWALYEVGIVFARHYKRRIAEAGEARDRRHDEESGIAPASASATGASPASASAADAPKATKSGSAAVSPAERDTAGGRAAAPADPAGGADALGNALSKVAGGARGDGTSVDGSTTGESADDGPVEEDPAGDGSARGGSGSDEGPEDGNPDGRGPTDRGKSDVDEQGP